MTTLQLAEFYQWDLTRGESFLQREGDLCGEKRCLTVRGKSTSQYFPRPSPSAAPPAEDNALVCLTELDVEEVEHNLAPQNGGKEDYGPAQPYSYPKILPNCFG
jgi:hypothetical protein